MAITQDQRQISVSGPLEQDALLFYRMVGSEELGRLFKYELDLVSTDANINLNDVLGKPLTVQLAMANEKKRYFNGYASGFRYMGLQGDYHLYKATLRPWLWFLTQSADCRIFQNKTVPDIIKEVFRDFGFSEFEDQLTEHYKQWDYCVQYRETAFNFVSRLMEQEGIYYYFKHQQDSHTLVLADSISAHARVSDYEQVPYYPPQQQERRESEYIDDWWVSKGIEPQKYTLSDFDFTKPKSSLEVRQAIEDGHADFEIFDYPGEYSEPDDGQAAVRIRAEQRQTQYERTQGKASVRAIGAGSLFELTNYPREDQNKEYLMVSARYLLCSDMYRTDKEAKALPVFRLVFSAMDSVHPYRSAQTTPQPKVQGPQTAVVVGPSGEKVWTDEYGRVKIQFHWDRYGKNDENSSCWIRVSHNWAGKIWGGMHIPHIGQEVIVDFLEGDPDRPIITGRVYNADNMPPIDLPKNKTKSIFRDDYGNELIFDATPGDEHIRLYSPHNNSGIEIGRSIKQWQGGGQGQEWITTSAGNAMEFFAGTKSEFLAGGTMEFKLGLFHEIALGLASSFKLGGSLGFNIGYDVSGQLGPKREWSKADVNSLSDKDNIISANNVLCLIGGAGKVAQPTDNTSIFRAEEEGITMSVGEKKGDFAPEFSAIAKIAMFSTVTNSVLAFLSQIAVEEVAVNVTPWALFAEVIPAYFAAGSIASAAAMSAALMDPSIKPKVVKHSTPKAKVNLDRSGEITINSTEKQVVISVGKAGQEKAQITLDNDGKITIKGKDVTFDGDGTIDMTKHVVKTAQGKLKVDDQEVRIKQCFRHKYLTVG